MSPSYEILFGDIHNHNALGYGVGSLERSIDVARGHLDFFAFTGHASWHDMEEMEGGREKHWLDGFERLANGWPKVQDLIADANRNPDFSAFLGYEWHSSHFGDQCVVFPEDHRPLVCPDTVGELRKFCIGENALMIPHHLAYPSGRRGVNWDVFDEACTPVVEIYSEHGNSESDRGPFDFFNHSMGGRQTSNTVRHALDAGMRFGFVASSDSHSGFPGAYGEGLMAALVTENSRPAILDAIRARRTYALTGDRIELAFTADGAQMGETIDPRASVEVAFDVRGRDEIDVVDIVANGHVVHRAHPDTRTPGGEAFSGPVQLRLEWGWGPWGDLALERTCDWAMDVRVADGRILRHFPCLQSGPFDEDRRHRFSANGARDLSIRSYTSRRGAYRQNPNQSVVLEVEGTADTAIELSLTQPVAQTVRTTLGQLLDGSVNRFTGPFPAEGYQWHRLLPLNESRVAGRQTVDIPDGRGQVYLRARQTNGQMAWASPVFVGHA
ncbi:MAG: DUF3604 domain-containing protein [Alphaproteobacteria bacterium]|nr:DUF3604 domain-containing protein [Alphaproteobacteria bacterium]